MFRGLRVALSTRRLFKNWLTAYLKYLLIKHGLVSGYVVVKCSNKIYRLSPDFYSFIVNKYYDGNIINVDCLDSIAIKYNGIPITVIPPDYVEFSYMGKRVKLVNPLPFLDDILFENFFGSAYDDIDVKGKIVVDIGAGIGDTAILFLLRGADKVIALEPYPLLYERALANIRINNLEDGVILLNAAASSTDGFAYAPVYEVRKYSSFEPKAQKSGKLVKIRTITLRTIVKDYGILNGVLKVDCEGCEYELFNSIESDIINAFEQIIIEYHNGPEPIVSKLKSLSYTVVIKPIRSSNIPINIQGYIIAKT